MGGNNEYKSDVFSMLMLDKKNALQLYNAMNGTFYEDPEQVEICNLEKGVSLSIRNDASFIVDSSLSIYEHQSSVCPNMPLRNLIYVTAMLREQIKKRNIFGRSLVRIPTPRFAVFYNGTEEQPEQSEYRLSDAFEHPTDKPELELICRVYNINKGKNKKLMEDCPILNEYMIFVDMVREYHRMNDYENLKEAIEKAIDQCIKDGVLKEFLMEHRAEVEKVMQLDYTFDRQLKLEREEGKLEGMLEGKLEGIEEGHQDERRIVVVRMVHAGMKDEEILALTECEQELIDEIRKQVALCKN